MTNYSARDVDKLVDIISRRVESAMQGGGAKAGHVPESCKSCDAVGCCDAKTVTGSLEQGAKRIGTDGPLGAAPCAHVAPYIDHTLLKPEATRDQLRQVCDEARQFGFATVCVNAVNVRYVSQQLGGCGTKAIAVVGFPLGASTPGAKAYETREAVRDGAEEIDTVINIGALKSRDHEIVFADVKAVVDAAGKVPVKVIIETSKLDRDEKIMACTLAKAAGAAFVKTSTGFGGGGATPDDVALMRAVVGPDIGVKASGGVRNIDDAEAVIAAGANRIGASSSIEIVQCKRTGGSGAKKGY